MTSCDCGSARGTDNVPSFASSRDGRCALVRSGIPLPRGKRKADGGVSGWYLSARGICRTGWTTSGHRPSAHPVWD
jgi:hypothetical protein